MKKKTKGTITSIFGVIFLLISTAMMVMNNFVTGYDFSWSSIISILVLGYVFLVADDKLIQRILLKRVDNDND